MKKSLVWRGVLSTPAPCQIKTKRGKKMNKYKIVVKFPMVSDVQIQEDSKDLIVIQHTLAHDKCVIIGNKIYTVDSIITIEQI